LTLHVNHMPQASQSGSLLVLAPSFQYDLVYDIYLCMTGIQRGKCVFQWDCNGMTFYPLWLWEVLLPVLECGVTGGGGNRTSWLLCP
jgi:hypothetical protein